MKNEKLDIWKRQMADFRFPRWNELPEIDLYMDQVVSYLNQKLAVFCDHDDADAWKTITSTMINNYVKQKIISAPVKKRYNRASVSDLMMLFCVKQVLSIDMTGTLLACCRAGQEPEQAHDRFCRVFEGALYQTVSKGESVLDTEELCQTNEVLYAAAVAFANQIYAGKLLSLYRQEAEADAGQKDDDSDMKGKDT